MNFVTSSSNASILPYCALPFLYFHRKQDKYVLIKCACIVFRNISLHITTYFITQKLIIVDRNFELMITLGLLLQTRNWQMCHMQLMCWVSDYTISSHSIFLPGNISNISTNGFSINTAWRTWNQYQTRTIAKEDVKSVTSVHLCLELSHLKST